MSFVQFLCFGFCFIAPAAFAQDSPATDDFLYAQKLFKEGYYELCLAQMEAFRQHYPDAQELAEGWIMTGEANLALRRFAEAETAFRMFEIRYAFHPRIEDVRLRLAESQKEQGQLALAAATLQRFVALHPRSEKAPLAQYQACALWRQLREYQKAREGLYALLSNYPESTQRGPAYLLLVESFFETGDYQRALQEAERMLRSVPPNQAEAQTFFTYGRAQEQVGHLQLAEQSYQEMIKKFSKGEGVGLAHARLAELQFARGEVAAAAAALERAMQEASVPQKNLLTLRAAEMQFEAGQNAEALATLQKFEAARGDSVARLRYYHALGSLHESTGKPIEAVAAFQEAVKLSPATDEVGDSTSMKPRFRRQHSLLRGAQIYFSLQQYDLALQWCRRYRREYPQGKFRDAMLLLEGRVQQRGRGNLAAAQRVYDELLADFPRSKYVDEAQYALAETYESAGEIRMAQVLWQRFVQLYPASAYAEAARRKLRGHAATTALDAPATLTQLSEALLQAQSNSSREDLLIALARLHYSRHDYRTALRYAQTAAESAEPPKLREAYFLLGASYYQLSEWEQPGEALSSARRDSAQQVLQNLTKTERDQFTAQAEALLARLWFGDQTPRTPAMRARADSLLALHEGDADWDFLRIWSELARRGATGTDDSTALHGSIAGLEKIAQNKNSEYRNAALYELADRSWQRGDSSKAAQYLEAMSASHWRDAYEAQGRLRQARWLMQQKHYEQALGVLQRMKQEYFYGAYADSAADLMTRVFMITGRFTEALQTREEESEEEQSENSAEEDLAHARLLQAGGAHALAVQAYLRFLATHPNAPEIPEVLLEAAQLTLRAGAERLAAGYYEECARRFPGTVHSVEAKFRLAEMNYDKGEFQTAQPLYLEAMNEQPNAPRAKEALKKWILCLYKTKNFSRAEAEAKKFEEQNKTDRAAVAEFQYAAGEAATEAKDFAAAERIFRKLGKDYRDTPSGILGDYGLGKALLIQNKTEEALETLTGIPQRYPKHPFLHTVYLGLGDFYQAQQQWDNAITAFNQVTKDSTFDGNYRLAIRSLLDVYDRMGLKDRALALARHYVARFPEDAKTLDLRIKVGLLLIDLLQFDDAIAHLKRLKPFVNAAIEPEVQYYIGKSHMSAGRFELAIAELLRVKFFSQPTKLPWDVIALYDAATCYTRINNCSMAKKLFQQIVREQGAASDFGRFANAKVAELSACEAAN